MTASKQRQHGVLLANPQFVFVNPVATCGPNSTVCSLSRFTAAIKLSPMRSPS